MRKSALIQALMQAAVAGVGMPGIAQRVNKSVYRGHAARKSVASTWWSGQRFHGKNHQTNESARRRIQIERGQLTASNGLVTG